MLPKFLPLKVCAHAYDSSLKTAKSSMSEGHIFHPLEQLHGICITAARSPCVQMWGRWPQALERSRKLLTP